MPVAHCLPGNFLPLVQTMWHIWRKGLQAFQIL
jgi:hypothetical protein